ncbi:STAS domain-containing protein [Thiomicrospira pelophila]|uniref:STAS domain-containing protein n=1 Tax=Thiomicrospira pelophila TaxID=934 RepID=UPI0004A7263D|nr:STAS domain-containing protein [Thiomicrospira pelophila]
MKWINQTSEGRLIFKKALMLSNLSEVWAELASINMLDVMTLDMAEVSQIDSAGIALLLDLQQRGSARLVLASPPASLQTLLSLYNLTEILPIAKETA